MRVNIKNPTVVFFIISFGVPWVALAISKLYNLDESDVRYLIIVGYSVSIGGIIAAFVNRGKTGLKELATRLFRLKYSFYWWLIALLIPFIYIAFAFILGSYLNNSYGNIELNKFWWMFSLPALSLVLGGPLAEEIGWRGYLLPELYKKYSLLTSSFIMGDMALFFIL